MSDEAAPSTPPTDSPRKGMFEGTFDRIRESTRKWFRPSEDAPDGIVVKGGGVQRQKYTQMRLLFVDVGNSSRSQMAQALALVAGFHAESAGTFPSTKLHPEVLQVMGEVGMDLSDFRPKPLNTNRLGAFDRVILFGDVLPKQLTVGIPIDHWNVSDPQGFPIDGYRQVRKDLEKRIKQLAKQHGVKRPETVLLTP
jgi:arsenate reductase